VKTSLLISTAAASFVAAALSVSPLLAAPSSPNGARGAAVQTLPGFRSPTGNIRCFVGNRLYCSIGSAAYAKQLQDRCLRPDGSGVDWHGFALSANRRATVFCTSNPAYNPNTQRPSYPKLAYGKTFRRGAFSCTSRITGVTCRNRAGHSLFISRQSWRAS
jgi:hypothetical protein